MYFQCLYIQYKAINKIYFIGSIKYLIFILYIQENIIDSRLKKLSIGFQVQIDELKLTVTQLQASKSEGTGNHNNDDHVRQLHKRQTSTSSRGRAVCESSSSLCTFYHPDHPDVGRTRATYNNGIVVAKSEVKEDPIKFNGMPTSCKDLQLLGHKLSGFYSVKVSQPNNSGTKIETVFCDFQSTDLINGMVFMLNCFSNS